MGLEARAFWAPGRVNLIGEFTDLVGGLVLPVALDLGIRLECVPSERTSLESDALPDDGGWQRYVAAVEVELAALGRPAVGIAGTVRSDLPIGSGLSSSAALEVAVATALCGVAEFHVEPLDLARALQRAEHRAVGVPSGIMDQAASLLGRAGHALLLDTGTLEYEYVPLPPHLALVVLDSGVSRQLESSKYGDRRRELEAGEPARVRHIETENARVREVVAILREPGQPRLAELGRLFTDGHASLRNDFEVTIPELDTLVELAREAGAVAARMTGGGFGGSIVALVEQERADAFARRVISEYRRRYGKRGRAYVSAASDGAHEL
ncbi:MAG: galactokinase [Gaiellaceae bacterium]